jgi:hypothetical protein
MYVIYIYLITYIIKYININKTKYDTCINNNYIEKNKNSVIEQRELLIYFIICNITIIWNLRLYIYYYKQK